MVEVNVSMKEALTKLHKLPGRLQERIIKLAVRAAAKPLVEEARRIVPKQTGNLSRSIGVTKLRTEGWDVAYAVSPRRGGMYDGWYGHFVEFGTRKMAPRPYLRPAFERAGADTIKAFKRYLIKRVDRELVKL